MTILLGLTPGYSKYPCHLCDFDSRADQSVKYNSKFKGRESWSLGKLNVKYEPMVDVSRIIIPPLHVKLGLFKNFIKSVGNKAMNYLRSEFFGERLTDEKVYEGIVNGPDIRRLMGDKKFRTKLNRTELAAFDSLVAYTKGFLGSDRAPNYRQLASNLKKAFERQNVSMSVKVHFAVDHVEDFAPDCGAYSDEQGERAHQDIKIFQKNYKGKDAIGMLADYCWSIKSEGQLEGRKKRKRLFL